MEWAVYYADGSTFTSEDGPPESAPRVGVQCVLQSDERVGYEVVCRTLPSPDGFWIWQHGRWWDSDTPGFWDYLMHSQEACVVLFGRWLPDEEYEAIVHKAIALGKSAWKKHERRR